MKFVPTGFLLLVLSLQTFAQEGRNVRPVADPQAYSEARIALVIGNGGYKESPLRNPVNDAEDIGRVLRQLGFDVEILKDGARREMLEAILRFGKKLEQGGVGLFFYAGHGVQVDRQNFLIPLRARIEKEEHVEFEAVKVDRVLAEMAAAENQMNIVVLDACRNNPYARSFRSQKRGLARLSAPGETFIAYATAPGAVAADGSGRNSPFTASLLQELPRPGLKVEDVFKRVAAAVKKKSKGNQSPWRTTSLTIDFYFIPPVPEAIPVTDLSRAARLGIKFAPVRGGTFQMGDQWGDVDSDEKRVHTVTVSDFEMSKHEITNQQFCAFLNERGNQEEGGVTWLDIKDEHCLIEQEGNRFTPKSGYQSHPVVQVSWYGAKAFAEWLDGRLPTEAEWEYAARARGREIKYPNGDQLTHDDANFSGTGGKDQWDRTAPVGSFQSNDLRLFDMAGNVWEWCQDWHGKYESGAQTNPSGPRSGDYRVLRGGSWYNIAWYCRTVYRNGYTPDNTYLFIGFRVVRSAR